MGALAFSGSTSNIIFNGVDITADSIQFNGNTTSVTSNESLTMATDEVEFTGNVNWTANDDLAITNSNQTSVLQNSSNALFDLKGNNLILDNVSEISGYNGSLNLSNINKLDIMGSQITQGALSIDANEVLSLKSLTVDSRDLTVSDELLWTAEAGLVFSRETDINSSTDNGGVSFNLSGNNLTFGKVGQGVTGIGELSVIDVDVLTLSDSIILSTAGNKLDFGLGKVNSIQLAGNVGLVTDNGDITLSPITAAGDDPDSGEAPTLSISSGSGNIETSSLLNIGNVAMSSTGAVTASGSMILEGNSLVIDAGEFYVDSSDGPISVIADATIDLNAPINSAIGTISDLSLAASNRIDIGPVGESRKLGELQLSTGGTVSLNGEALFSDTLSVDANNLNLTTDTVMVISGSSGLFNDTDITGNAGQTLEIRAAAAEIELDSVNVGALTVDASQLKLKGSVATTIGDLDLSLADAITLVDNTTLNSGSTGSLTLSDDVAGSYDLSLFVDQGNLALGSQKGGATKLNSMTISDASPSPLVGTNSTTEGISVINLLDLSNSGVLAVSQNASFMSENGDVVLTGTSIEADGSSVSVSAGNRASLGEIYANSFTLASDIAILSNDITATNRLDLSQAVDIRLDNDIRLTGPLLLSTGSASTSVNGNHALTIDATNQNLTLFDMGNTEALDSLAVVNASTLQIAGGITTQGLDGIGFSGSRLNLTADTRLNTSSSNGTIDLSGIGVNGDFTLTLNAGTGNVSLADVGQDVELASLVVEDATQLALGGDIRTADTLLDLSNVQSVVLSDDVSVDTRTADGGITLGDSAIDGTFTLSLYTGAGTVQLADVGQAVALQSLTVESAADLLLDNNISVIDGLTVSGNQLALDSSLKSSGGQVTLESGTDLNMSVNATVEALGDVSFLAEAGSIRLGKVTSESGVIELIASSGSIYNTLNDFVSVENTSVNLSADRVNLVSGQDIGSGPADPIVLDVPQAGLINLLFTAPLAYIVNINQSEIIANGRVFDILSSSRQAALSAYRSANLAGELQPWEFGLAAPEPDSELFAITQPGYVLASNVLMNGSSLSSDIPSVPNIRLRDNEWWLLYSRNSIQ
jgi:hypothetical protein